ncbi:hypothetical protein E4U61_006857 [Claviceps capensis]|nr:hypothetical protein E4U61_006857 [Claviceps capensis]
MVKCEPEKTVEAVHRGLKRDAAQRDMIITVDWNRPDPQAPRPGDDRLRGASGSGQKNMTEDSQRAQLPSEYSARSAPSRRGAATMDGQMAPGATRVAYLDRPVDFAEPATQDVSEVPLAEADAYRP